VGADDEHRQLAQQVADQAGEIERLTQQLDGLRRLRVQGLEHLVESEAAHADLSASIDEIRHREQALAAELVAVQRHREELAQAVNAICASESWRLGHALTWPARAVRRHRSKLSSRPPS
jgi:hypothetical protein